MDASTAISLHHQFDSQGFDDAKKDEEVAEAYGVCAICMERIVIQEAALVKGCEHAYCVTCILRWATYTENPSCPQCKNPFESLNIHRSLDGTINDYMFEESVCLLLRATWFVPLAVVSSEEIPEEPEDLYHYFYEGLDYNYDDEDDDSIHEGLDYNYDDEDDDSIHEALYCCSNSSNMRIGNRKWGDNGYVRAGRKEAHPINSESDAGSSQNHNNKKDKKEEPTKDVKGRRAKRAMKREAADKAAAAAKHEEHLQRFGWK